MKYQLVCVALGLFLASSEANATEFCKPLPVTVTIATPVPQVQVKPSNDLGASTRNVYGGRTLAPSGWHVTGMASAKPKFEISVEVVKQRNCVRPTNVTVNVGFEGPIDVAISSKYPPGSCEYSSIYQHEMTHVQIMTRSISEYRDAMNLAVSNAIAAMDKSVYLRQDAKDYIFYQAQMAVKSVFDRMLAVSKMRNAAIDTEQNYLAEQSRCSNW